MKKKLIHDIIADGLWKNPDPNGERQSAYIAIGRPEQDNTQKHEEWRCPIYIEHFTKQVVDARGIGPLDALMNTMTLLRQFIDMNHCIEPLKIKRPTSRSSRRAKARGCASR